MAEGAVAAQPLDRRGVSARKSLPRWFWFAAIAYVPIASAWIAHNSNTQWDYPLDAGPPIDDLAHLRIHEALSHTVAMGPLSLFIRAPFAALGQALGSGGKVNYYLDDYRFGVFACLVLAGLFGLALARFAEQRGRGPLVCAAAVVLPLVNPVTLRSVFYGHPEEVLGAALLAGAMLAAVARRPWLAAGLVALAVANKQWGLIGLPAVVVVMWASVGWQRLRTPALIIVGIGVLLAVPVLVADYHGAVDMTRRMADMRGTYTFPADIWYSIAPDLSPERAAHSLNGLRAIPDWLGLIARPLIILMGIVVPLAFAKRVRADVLHRAFPLLALVMLLRCALDPADNGYYHVPFLLALIAADAINGRYWATVIAMALLQAPTTFHMSAQTLASFYVIWAPAFAVYLGFRTYGYEASAARTSLRRSGSGVDLSAE